MIIEPRYKKFLAFKIMPDTCDPKHWPEWVTNLKNTSNVSISYLSNTVFMQKAGSNLEIIKNGHWLIINEDRSLVRTLSDHLFQVEFKTT